jgi:hypothetical protein
MRVRINSLLQSTKNLSLDIGGAPHVAFHFISVSGLQLGPHNILQCTADVPTKEMVYSGLVKLSLGSPKTDVDSSSAAKPRRPTNCPRRTRTSQVKSGSSRHVAQGSFENPERIGVGLSSNFSVTKLLPTLERQWE